MSRGRRAAPLAALAAALTLTHAVPAAGQLTLVEGDRFTAAVGGYTRSLSAVHDLGFDLPVIPGVEVPARTSGIHSQVVRLKWRVEGSSWRVDVHDRIQLRVTSGEAGDAGGFGFGVSAIPDRLIDLEHVLVEEERLRLWHDLDRLSVTIHTPAADVTLGRQPITWGTAMLFPVADLWARFSPFEQDTDEKPGIDAARALFYPADGLEMDAVVAYRDSLENLSLGLRGTLGLPAADVWAGAGKFWRQAMLMGGVTLLLEESKLRGEVVLPYDLDRGELQRPRATVGADWIRGTLILTGEYHYNGIGTNDFGRYPAVAGDPRFARGETYYLGRHYLGGLAAWSPDEENRLNLAFNALFNLGDASSALTPVASYDLGQATRVSLGGLLSFGETPLFTATPPFLEIRSEFASRGDLAFAMLSVYF